MIRAQLKTRTRNELFVQGSHSVNQRLPSLRKNFLESGTFKECISETLPHFQYRRMKISEIQQRNGTFWNEHELLLRVPTHSIWNASDYGRTFWNRRHSGNPKISALGRSDFNPLRYSGYRSRTTLFGTNMSFCSRLPLNQSGAHSQTEVLQRTGDIQGI